MGTGQFGLIAAGLVVSVIGISAAMVATIQSVEPANAEQSVGLTAPGPVVSTRARPTPSASATGPLPELTAAAGAARAGGVVAASTTRPSVRTPPATPGTGTGGSGSDQAGTPGAGGTGQGRIQYGHIYRGQATFYAATGAGNCTYEASSDLMVGAMNQQDYDNSQSCGAYLAVTGPNGTTITIKVVDRCPECPPGAIDLSREAFTRLAPASVGQIPISWKLLSPPLRSPVGYRYKEGSSQYWCGIQVRDHRNPIRTLELQTGSTWKQIPRQEYNYFVSSSGAGCGGPIRITDIYGNRLTDNDIRISPGIVQRGHAQLPAR